MKTLLAAGRSDLLQRQSDGTVRFAPALSNRGDLEAAGSDLGDALDRDAGLGAPPGAGARAGFKT